ncbi:fumarylacetoacetate hydrolase domain-containing protein 2 [Ctenocephalides felis]|uniref:fumarylacetoacetate hydrolase domain-containing protein 2 n=1 Tax=Ctenocephalides felis TaxID=7515 RepID=UPI000E6E19BF|nr:fumarylacetoacetate hydrolase domain-containing protein 2 [Ctenocephalides felis]
MNFVQFQKNDNCQVRTGLKKNDGTIVELLLRGKPASMLSLLGSGELENLDYLNCRLKEPGVCEKDVTLLPPITKPDKVICIGLNYKSHCDEQGIEPPDNPMFFSKFSSTIIGYEDNIEYPPITKELDWEVELCVVIGKTAKCIRKEEAFDHVFGYCVSQDISARDWQKRFNGRQFLLGKSMDTFCPLGPSIIHKSAVKDPNNLKLKCWVNGELKQDGNTKDLIFKIDECISRLSQCFTLFPGDIILTGTPGGVGMARTPPQWLKPGDVIESEIEGLGKMTNHIVCP